MIIRIDGNEYDDIVPQNYRFNPVTENMVYGDRLQNGMLVLVEEMWRNSENDAHPPNQRDLLITNRWCAVTQLRHDGNNGGIVFIGEYSDGQKAVRQSGLTWGWHVKKTEIEPNHGDPSNA